MLLGFWGLGFWGVGFRVLGFRVLEFKVMFRLGPVSGMAKKTWQW